MKKYIVENAIRTAEEINASINPTSTDNFVGDSIEAETAEEAIEIAMDYIAEQINGNGEYTAEVVNGSVIVTDDNGDVVEEYCMFSAK